MTNNSFTVLMSVYKNDNPVHFRIAVESVTINQTLPPNEVVIVVDGPVPDELASTIKTLENEIPYIKVHWLSHNGGLGNALRIGVEIASNEIIVRMDSDDVSTPDRFEKQIRYMTEHP